MKKNGFTIIELVTIISLLSIVALVLAPKIGTAFKTTHADQLEEVRDMVGKATDVYFNNECGKDSYNKLINDDKVKIYLKNLVNCGLIKDKIYNSVSDNYFDINNEYVEASIDEVGLINYEMSF